VKGGKGRFITSTSRWKRRRMDRYTSRGQAAEPNKSSQLRVKQP